MPDQPSWVQLVQYYFRGIITEAELFIAILANVTADNVHELLDECRTDILQKLTERAANLPESPRVAEIDPVEEPFNHDSDEVREREVQFQNGLRIFRDAVKRRN